MHFESRCGHTLRLKAFLHVLMCIPWPFRIFAVGHKAFWCNCRFRRHWRHRIACWMGRTRTAEIGSSSAGIAQIWPRAPLRSMSAGSAPTSSKFGPKLAHLGPIGSEFDRDRPTIARIRLILGVLTRPESDSEENRPASPEFVSARAGETIDQGSASDRDDPAKPRACNRPAMPSRATGPTVCPRVVDCQ